MAATDVTTDIEACCEALYLTQTLRSTLGKFPGCTHWHYKLGRPQGKAKGTLEITLWPKQHRLWLALHENRKTDWTAGGSSRAKS